MPGNEVKQRKKIQSQGNNNAALDQTVQQTYDKSENSAGDKLMIASGDAEKSSAFPPDIKTCVCLFFTVVCLGLLWIILQQNSRFSDLEEKYRLVNRKAGDFQELHVEVSRISQKFESLPDVLGRLEGQLVQAQVEKLEVDVEELKRWKAAVVEKREGLQVDLVELMRAVRHMEERTATVAKDAAAQVSSARTDMRRMSGLGAETEALLARMAVLEGRVARAETAMAKRIGDLLAGSIERVSALRGLSERNSQAAEKLWQGAAKLEAADGELAGRLLALENGHARLLKTVTFASDVKPKVATIRRELAMLEPLLSDLILRVGHLAQDLGHREGDIALLWDALTSLSASEQLLAQVPS
ncbi:inhibitor of nuclear factor kappa-B kinase-interacting protein isoform X2 [Paramormyrops kingsleyae]|uniref:inhibitor of nuclear factor kappa-B kinase-interacting protein isoform X2 n=1 Tax=Paramormyrops kingsleyae TaxID=1676925 RepID=UPI003B97CE1C